MEDNVKDMTQDIQFLLEQVRHLYPLLTKEQQREYQRIRIMNMERQVRLDVDD